MSASIDCAYYKSPVGDLIIGVYNDAVCMIDWKYRKMRSQIDQRICSFFKSEYIFQGHPLHDVVTHELEAYFQKQVTTFSFPLNLAGTSFQCEIWKLLQQIPYGKTLSYLQLAKLYGNELAIRAVASANGANAISIVIPCHRIIGSKGELTGYAGGIQAKKKLLQLEGNNLQAELF
ncbi:MAG: methylated-DNA--[protein]-cysteine S-methyltransferase [Chitinophagaceae bacterium]|nr:methylated-DNA--[protein]-cysteine S-methyltransferase [Chitinophagaceae bacterium]